MNAFVLTWPQLLYVGLGLVVFYIAQLLLFLRKVRVRAPDLDVSRRQTELEDEIDHLRREVEGLKLRLAMSAHLQEEALVEVEADTETPYAHAIRMARAGAEVDAMIRECGISRGEADLIVALYRAERQG
ncbi:MAG TPA: DUF2802 domain-containing protein [Chitinolyticbacter sp.]|uniref:DUF2802 domain-containing protein n=1 Tax=Chitinolyticbacter albus TaxID=2961951 RepID=UPI00210C5D44|nr:DUF2802 domain-containing protein [Chitinolyticbacter albus]HSC80655.1 DUF2802 domain-containing protein [Chitinolyticbacter sp.]